MLGIHSRILMVVELFFFSRSCLGARSFETTGVCITIGVFKFVGSIPRPQGGRTSNRLFYLSIPHNIFIDAVKCATSSASSGNGWTRVIVEKPFGRDSESSAALTKSLKQYLIEDQIFRMELVDEFFTSETAEHLVSTPPHVSNANSTLLPRFDKRKNRSEVWDHFSEPNSDKKASCNYCGNLIKCDHGTSSLRTHLKRCKDHPDRDPNKRRKSTLSSIGATEGHVGSSRSTVARFDQQVCRDAIVKMFVATELPFRFIENEDFRWCMNVVSPKLNLTSRTTMARDVLILWQAEKVKLKKFLVVHCTRVCLTMDIWTSCQNMCYMCLTAHFIDKNWKLHKKILNFCQVKSHSGEVMAKTVLSCLNDWGLNRVFSLTVDNASSNDTGIQNLKKSLMLQSNLVLKGDHIHMRCFVHILNLIVKEELKDIDDSILRIRAVVKYIRSSPSEITGRNLKSLTQSVGINK